MNTRLRFLLSFVLLSGVLRPAQAYSEQTACWWLQLSSTVAGNGMGTVNSPYSTDPLASWFLPGVSGIGPDAPQGTTIEYSGYSPRTDWFPDLGSGLTFGSWALRLRTPLGKALDAVSERAPGLTWRPSNPMTLSIGVIHQRLARSGFFYSKMEPSPYRNEPGVDDYSTSLRLELGWQLQRWRFGTGLGYDQVTSNIGPYMTQDRSYDGSTGRIGTFDLGLVVERKLLDRVPLRTVGPQGGASPWLFDLGVAGSWARDFIGGEIRYEPVLGSDPMPRQDRMALASRLRVIHAGSASAADIDLLRVHVAAEHFATLVDKYPNPVIVNGIPDADPGGYAMDPNSTDDPDKYSFGLKYKLFEPDIFGDDRDITRSWGTEVCLFDMVTVRKGRHEYHEGGILEDTRGWGLDSNGLFRLLERGMPGVHSKPVLGWMLRSLRVRYDKAEWESNSFRNETQFRQVTVDVAF